MSYVGSVSKQHSGSTGALPAWTNHNGSTGLATGDRILLGLGRDSNDGTTGTVSADGSTWSTVAAFDRLSVITRLREPGDGNYTLASTAPIDQHASAGIAIRGMGAIQATTSQATSGSGVSSVTAPSLNVDTAGSTLIAFVCMQQNGASAPTGPAGFTLVAWAVRWRPNTSVWVKENVPAGATGTQTFSVSESTLFTSDVLMVAVAPAAPAITKLADVATAGTTGTGVLSLSATIPAGGVPVGALLTVAHVRTASFVSAVTDSKGNAYTVHASSAVQSTSRAAIASGVITTPLVSGDTVTVTTGAAASQAMSLTSWAGADLTADRVTAALAEQGSATLTGAAAAGPVTPNSAGLSLAAYAISTATTVTPTAPDVLLPVAASTVASIRNVYPAYRLNTAPGTFTHAAGFAATRAYSSIAVHFKAAGAPNYVERVAVAYTATATLAATLPETASVAYTAEATLTVTPAVEAVTAAVRYTASAHLDVLLRPVGKQRRLVVTDINGLTFGELENATVGAIRYGLNEPEDWAFTLPLTDPKAALLVTEQFREVQLWRGDQLLAWGPTVRPSANKSDLAVNVKGALWYLTRRHIGRANRVNYVTNGDFEQGLTGWDVSATSPFESAGTKSPLYWDGYTTFDRSLTGRRSLYMEQHATAAPKYGIGATQFFLWQVDQAVTPMGDHFTLAARCYIPSEDWRGPRSDQVGLRVSLFSTVKTVSITPEGGGTPITFPAPIETIVANIDENTPRDVWTRLEVTIETRPSMDPEFVQIELACPDGAIYWDRVGLTVDEGLRYYGIDQALIAAGLIDHLQDPDYGKSPLNLSTDTPLTGVKRDRGYAHHEHQNGFDVLSEFTTLDTGFDLSVAYTPTSRTIRTHHPRRGKRRPEFALELGRNIADFAWAFDGEAAADSVIVLGVGEGSDREEASATDTSAFTGGLTLEQVFSAPPETAIEGLDDLAAEVLATATRPDMLSVSTTAAMPGQRDPIGVLGVGDIVPVTIRAGVLDIVGDYRVVELTITPDDTLELVLNRW